MVQAEERVLVGPHGANPALDCEAARHLPASVRGPRLLGFPRVPPRGSAGRVRLVSHTPARTRGHDQASRQAAWRPVQVRGRRNATAHLGRGSGPACVAVRGRGASGRVASRRAGGRRAGSIPVGEGARFSGACVQQPGFRREACRPAVPAAGFAVWFRAALPRSARRRGRCGMAVPTTWEVGCSARRVFYRVRRPNGSGEPGRTPSGCASGVQLWWWLEIPGPHVASCVSRPWDPRRRATQGPDYDSASDRRSWYALRRYICALARR